jgi:UDP-N-acetylmuramate dehydrogenase
MITIQENVLLAPYTTFKIGGLARYFSQVSNIEGVKEVICWAQKQNQEIHILGGGSNVLISDSGYPGLVVHLAESVPVVIENGLRVFSGCRLMTVVETAQQNGLAGIERLAGVPGTIGGATYGNAGAFGTEIKDVVTEVIAIHIKTLEEKKFSNKQCEFGYRNSYFKMNSGWIVAQVEVSLKEGNKDHLLTVMEDILEQRNAKQTQDVNSAGSYFINPVIEDEGLRREFEKESGAKSREKKVPAGWLIDRVGLRGKKIGGAMVSEEHPNYILNVGGATAEDVVILESFIKQQVRDAYNVELQREVRYVGF